MSAEQEIREAERAVLASALGAAAHEIQGAAERLQRVAGSRHANALESRAALDARSHLDDARALVAALRSSLDPEHS